MSQPVEVVVTVDDAHVDTLAEVAARLRAAGMEVKDVLDAVGVVTGSIDESRVPELANVEGVEGVERSRQYRVPPPESDLQ